MPVWGFEDVTCNHDGSELAAVHEQEDGLAVTATDPVPAPDVNTAADETSEYVHTAPLRTVKIYRPSTPLLRLPDTSAYGPPSTNAPVTREPGSWRYVPGLPVPFE